MIVYHVDRSGMLQEEQELILCKDIPDIELPEFEHEPYKFDILQHLFAEGVNPSHTQNYLQSHVSSFDHVNLMQMELYFEFVRRSFFSCRPSRFQSLFALRSLTDLDLWPELCQSSSAQVFEIKCPDTMFIGDSSFLRGGPVFLPEGMVFYTPSFLFDYACRYWAGDTSDTPRWEILIPFPVIIGKRIR